MLTMTPVAFEVRLPDEYDRAVDRVTTGLKAEGFGVLTRIDVHATLREKLGVQFRPYAILGACSPPLAHRALTQQAAVGLLLPCNVTIEADPRGEGSIVRIADPKVMLSTADFGQDPDLQAVASEARSRLERVARNLKRT